MPRFLFSSQTFFSRSPKATILAAIHSNEYNDPSHIREPTNDALLVLLPLLIVLSTFLFLLLLFLICVLLLRRRRGIALRDTDGPIDMSRSDLVHGEGGFDGVESRWLESVNDNTRRIYSRAKGASFFPALIPNRQPNIDGGGSSLPQIINCNTRPTHRIRTSLYLSFCLFRRKASRRGLLIPTTR